MDVPLWQIPAWIVTLLAGGGVIRHYLYDRPKVRLRASLDSRSVHLMEPIVEFKMTNERKEEVHVSAITIVRKMKGEVSHDVLSTTPSKGTKFRLAGLEQETFTATWEDIVPDDLKNPCSLDDVIEIYVENIATGKRWKLPPADMDKIREGLRETLAYRREKAEWRLTCRNCKRKMSWMARPPKADGSFQYGGFGEEEGWTAHDWGSFPMEAKALCPGCTAINKNEAAAKASSG